MSPLLRRAYPWSLIRSFEILGKKVIQFHSHGGTAGDCEIWWERNCETNHIKMSWNNFFVCVIVPKWMSKTFWKENVFRKTEWYQFMKFSKWKRASSNYENPVDLTLSSHLINDFLNCDWEIIAHIRVSLARILVRLCHNFANLTIVSFNHDICEFLNLPLVSKFDIICMYIFVFFWKK